MPNIDYNELSNEISRVFSLKNPTRHPLFQTLKQELSVYGYWRNKPRGNPSKGYQAMRDKQSP